MTAQLGNLLRSISSRQEGRGFSLSLSALALSQVVMSQALEEKRQNEENKIFNAYHEFENYRQNFSSAF